MTDDSDDDKKPTTVRVNFDQFAADASARREDLAKAYARLGLGQGIASDFAKTIGPIVDQWNSLHTAVPANILEDHAMQAALQQHRMDFEAHDLPDIPFDGAPQRTANAAEEMVEVMRDVHAVTADLVRLTHANVQLTEAQQASARRTERFTRGMTWASLSVAVASLGAAVAAILMRG